MVAAPTLTIMRHRGNKDQWGNRHSNNHNCWRIVSIQSTLSPHHLSRPNSPSISKHLPHNPPSTFSTTPHSLIFDLNHSPTLPILSKKVLSHFIPSIEIIMMQLQVGQALIVRNWTWYQRSRDMRVRSAKAGRILEIIDCFNSLFVLIRFSFFPYYMSWAIVQSILFSY